MCFIKSHWINPISNLSFLILLITEVKIVKRIINKVSIVYLDENIQDRLDSYSHQGYKLVSTEYTNDNNHLRRLYLFFVKEVDK